MRLVVTLASFVLVCVTAWWEESAIAGVRWQPKRTSAWRYDPLRDDFDYRESVLTPRQRRPAWAERGYTGNRLRQFRYIGPPGTGGLYDALEEHKRSLPLDPKNYRYRLRR